MFLALVLIAFGGYRGLKAAFFRRPSFKPRVDAGSAEVDEGKQPLAIDSQVILRPNIADVEYDVSTDDASLIVSIRRRND